MIDLRSDTLTLPTEGMLKAMQDAPLGDDGFGEDAATKLLEVFCAELLGKEAALFTPTGTMSNQLALRVHTRPGDEVIIDESYHFNVYESAPSTDLAGISLNTVRTEDGILTPTHVFDAIEGKCRDPRYTQARMVGVENTINYRSGRVFPVDRLRELRSFTQGLGLRMHLDGARLFNAVVTTGIEPAVYGGLVDSLSICFAKGLGAPFGSALAGTADMIDEARYYRKSYGGAMHQCGGLAAAALYSLRYNVDRLAEDHATARCLADLLNEHPMVEFEPDHIESNILIVDVQASGADAKTVAEWCKQTGLLVVPLSSRKIRFVTRMGVTNKDVTRAADIFCTVLDDIARRHQVHGRSDNRTAEPSLRY